MNKRNLKSLIEKQITFNSWSRKGFAVFASLKSVVKIGFLSGTISILATPTKGYSQTDTIQIGNHLDIDEVVVSGERSPEVYSKISRVVTLIPKESVLRTPAQSLLDVLEYSPGVDLRVRGKHGVQADLNIRGGSFDQNVILLNGINISNPQTGHLSLNLPVDIEAIQQIEILEGPSSRITGANAFSGAVNFVTNTDSANRVLLHGMYGEHNLYKVNLSANVVNNNVRNFVALSLFSSDGFTHNTDFNSKSLFYNGNVDFDNGKLGFQLGLADKDYGSNNFYSTRFKDQWEENTSSLASIDFSTGTNLKITTSAYWRRMYDHFVLIRNMPEIYQNFHVTDVIGSNMNASFYNVLGKTTIGADLRNESIHSNNLGYDTQDTILVPGQDSIYYDKFHSRNNVGLFIEQSYHTEHFSVSAGGVYNFNTDQGLSGKFYPGIDLSYNITTALKVYGSINSSVRMPTFTDLFYVGAENVGNPNLEAEEAVTYELGFKSSLGFITGNASYFFRNGKNIIDWNKNSEDDAVWTPSNITELNTGGIELQAYANLSKLALNPIYGLRSAQIGMLFLDVTKSSSNTISRYALDHLNSKITAGVDIRIYRGLYANIQAVYQDRNGDYIVYNAETESYDSKEYEPFTLMDAKLYYEHKNFTPYVEVSNVFDGEYNDIGGVPQPGRWIRGGVKINLDF